MEVKMEPVWPTVVACMGVLGVLAWRTIPPTHEPPPPCLNVAVETTVGLEATLLGQGTQFGHVATIEDVIQYPDALVLTLRDLDPEDRTKTRCRRIATPRKSS